MKAARLKPLLKDQGFHQACKCLRIIKTKWVHHTNLMTKWRCQLNLARNITKASKPTLCKRTFQLQYLQICVLDYKYFFILFNCRSYSMAFIASMLITCSHQACLFPFTFEPQDDWSVKFDRIKIYSVRIIFKYTSYIRQVTFNKPGLLNLRQFAFRWSWRRILNQQLW